MLFHFGMATDIGDGKLNLKLLNSAWKIDLVSNPTRAEGWENDNNNNNNKNPIYATPPLGQDMTQGQFLKRSLTGLNSEFSFS